MSDISERLKHFRLSIGNTQRQIADELAVKPSYYSDLENGRRAVSGKSMEKLRQKFGLSIDWLCTGEGSMFTDETVNKDTKKGTNKLSIKSTAGTLDEKTRLKKHVLSAEDIRDLFDLILSERDATKPTRYAKSLSSNQLDFEYSLSLENLRGVFEDYKSLKEAMYKMGPPSFMVEKWPKRDQSFDEYLKETETDHVNDEKNPQEYKTLKENKLYLIEKVYHPATEHLKKELSMLIRYLNEYGDMFTGGDWIKAVKEFKFKK